MTGIRPQNFAEQRWTWLYLQHEVVSDLGTSLCFTEITEYTVNGLKYSSLISQVLHLAHNNYNLTKTYGNVTQCRNARFASYLCNQWLFWYIVRPTSHVRHAFKKTTLHPILKNIFLLPLHTAYLLQETCNSIYVIICLSHLAHSIST